MARGRVFLGEMQGIVDDPGDTLVVPRVDHQSTAQTASRSSELAQDQRSVILLLTHDVLERSRVHAIPDRSNQSNIGNREKRIVLVAINVLVIVVHRRKVQRPKRAVDIRHHLGDLSLQLGVLNQGRRGHLDEDHFSLHLWVVGQELFKGLQLLLDTLDGVELVTANNDALARVQLADRLHLGQDAGGLALAFHTLGVDTDREGADPNSGTLGVHTARSRFVSIDAGAAADEVSGV